MPVHRHVRSAGAYYLDSFVQIVRNAWKNPLNQTLVQISLEIARSVNQTVYPAQPNARRANVMFLKATEYRHDEIAYRGSHLYVVMNVLDGLVMVYALEDLTCGSPARRLYLPRYLSSLDFLALTRLITATAGSDDELPFMLAQGWPTAQVHPRLHRSRVRDYPGVNL